MVWAALTFVTRLPRPLDTPVVVKVVRVSGTIRKAEEEVIRRAKVIVKRAKNAEGVVTGDVMIASVAEAVEKRRDAERQALAEVDEDDDESGSDSE